MSEFVGVVTTTGQKKIAAAIGGAALNLTVIRVGDGNGAPIVPAPGMNDLVHRVGIAYPIISSGRDPVNLTHWRVTALIPAAEGPFDIREIGVFDAAGDMIAIARHVLVEKRSPAQGAAVELTTDIVFPVSETAQVTVQIQPSAAVSILQLLRAGFCCIESAQIANPPANPALGATYVVAAAATGAWAGLTGRLVQWNGTVWVAVEPLQGFLVVALDRVVDHAERWLRRVAGGWASAEATENALGVVRRATLAEVQDRANVKAFITPSDLWAGKYPGFRGNPQAQNIPSGSVTRVTSFANIVNNLPGATYANGIITVGQDGYYDVSANMASLLPDIGNYGAIIAVSKVNGTGAAIQSIASTPFEFFSATSIPSTRAAGCSGTEWLAAGDRIAAFMAQNTGAPRNVAIALNVRFAGA